MIVQEKEIRDVDEDEEIDWKKGREIKQKI
jgi:hypothetical protein